MLSWALLYGSNGDPMSSNSGGISIAGTVPEMQRHKIQKGRLFSRHGAWHVEFYREVPSANGVPRWQQTSSVIGRLSEFPRQQDIWNTFQGFMQGINDRYVRVASMDPPFCAFVEELYLKSEHVQSLSPSTTEEYIRMWKHYLKPRLNNETLGSVRTPTVNKMLEAIVRDHDVSKYTIQHIKALLSGIYTWARNNGHFDGANPVIGVKLPKARGKSETYAYNLFEELAIMKLLQPREMAAVATASFAGLSKSELQGLRWEDRIDGCLCIRRSVWDGIEKETKTENRVAAVPIIPQLDKILDAYWKACGRPASGWVWPAARGNLPMALSNLYRRHIAGPMKKAKLTWNGWHAFRRGLASNLSELGVPDDVIQKILRHGDLGTTQKFYRKTRPTSVTKAMKKLSRRLSVVSKSKSTTDKQRTAFFSP